MRQRRWLPEESVRAFQAPGACSLQARPGRLLGTPGRTRRPKESVPPAFSPGHAAERDRRLVKAWDSDRVLAWAVPEHGRTSRSEVYLGREDCQRVTRRP